MKISEYVSMIKAGYTKSEIDAIVAAEKETEEQKKEAPVEEPVEIVEPSENAPMWAEALASSIAHLTKSVESMNRAALEQPEIDPNIAVDTALKNYLGVKNKEEK